MKQREVYVIDYLELTGYISGLLLAFCGLPEAIRSIKHKKCDIGWGLLLMWMGGEIGLLIYETKDMALPRILNYSCNIVFISVMIYYKIRNYSICDFCVKPCNNSWCSSKERDNEKI